MFKRIVFAVCLIIGFALPITLSAQDDMPDQPIPVSGSFDYTWAELAATVAGDTYIGDYSEDEIWVGDFEGTAVSPFCFSRPPQVPLKHGCTLSLWAQYLESMRVLLL